MAATNSNRNHTMLVSAASDRRKRQWKAFAVFLFLVVPLEVGRVMVSEMDLKTTNGCSHEPVDNIAGIFRGLHRWMENNTSAVQYIVALPLLVHFMAQLVLLEFAIFRDHLILFDVIYAQIVTILLRLVMVFPLRPDAVDYSAFFLYINESRSMDAVVNWHVFIALAVLYHATFFFQRRDVRIVSWSYLVIMVVLTLSARTTSFTAIVLALLVFWSSCHLRARFDLFVRFLEEEWTGLCTSWPLLGGDETEVGDEDDDDEEEDANEEEKRKRRSRVVSQVTTLVRAVSRSGAPDEKEDDADEKKEQQQSEEDSQLVIEV